MIGEWHKEYCSEKPEELQLISSDRYIERKDIKEVVYPSTESQESYTGWECISREIGVNEYRMLESISNINANKAIDDYTMQLIEEGIL